VQARSHASPPPRSAEQRRLEAVQCVLEATRRGRLALSLLLALLVAATHARPNLLPDALPLPPPVRTRARGVARRGERERHARFARSAPPRAPAGSRPAEKAKARPFLAPRPFRQHPLTAPRGAAPPRLRSCCCS
jgi:hypothetical protein